MNYRILFATLLLIIQGVTYAEHETETRAPREEVRPPEFLALECKSEGSSFRVILTDGWHSATVTENGRNVRFGSLLCHDMLCRSRVSDAGFRLFINEGRGNSARVDLFETNKAGSNLLAKLKCEGKT